MLHEGVWGTVCDHGWNDVNAAVVCRQLGMSADNAQATFTAHFGEGTGEIWLDDVSCEGPEGNLGECSHNGWGNHSCAHDEDVGVICAGNILSSLFRYVCFAVHFCGQVVMGTVN